MYCTVVTHIPTLHHLPIQSQNNAHTPTNSHAYTHIKNITSPTHTQAYTHTHTQMFYNTDNNNYLLTDYVVEGSRPPITPAASINRKITNNVLHEKCEKAAMSMFVSHTQARKYSNS